MEFYVEWMLIRHKVISQLISSIGYERSDGGAGRWNR